MKIKLNYARQLWLSLLLLVGVAAIAVPGLNGTNSGGVAKIGSTEYATLESAFAEVKDGETVTLLADVTLSGNLELALEGKSVTFDLDGKTLNGRTNLKSGSLTVKNGTVNCEGGQPLNVYGTATAGAENYSVLTVAEDVTVSGAYGVCLFGPSYSAKAGYGAVANIAGTLNGTDGTVFVSGNLGNNIDGDMNNVINITGKINGNNDAGVALNGNATVNVKSGAEITGNTGIAIKRGVLNVEEGATVHATGAENLNPGANNNGTEMTGAAISMTDTYNNYGAMAVNITGGTFTSDNTVALFKEDGTYTNDATFSVSGGTFSSAIPAEFCSEGYKVVENSGTWTVQEITNVAQIGNKKYVSLEAAFAEVKDGETITLLDNVTLSSNLELALEGKSVTFDLGWNTLSGRTNLKSGSLTVKNGTVNCEGGQPLNVYGTATAGAENYSVLTVAEDVTVSGAYGVCMFGPTGSAKAGYGAVANIAGTLNGTDGTVFVSGNLGNNIDGDMNNVINITGKINGNNDAGVALNGNATVNVQSGAEITGNTGIAVKRGVLNVEDGATVHATGAENLTPGANNNGTEMTGAAISMTDTYNNYGAMAVNITGGTFTSDNTVALFKEDGTYANDATFSVSGGTFSSAVPDEFCAEGYIPTDLGDGKYSVKEGAYVAQVGTAKYETFEEAIAAVTDGATLSLLEKATLANPVTCPLSEGESFTLNLGSNSISPTKYVLLNPGVTVYTDKTSKVSYFISVENGYAVVNNKGSDGKYFYTVEEADIELTNSKNVVSYEKISNYLSISGSGDGAYTLPSDGTYKLLKDITIAYRINPGSSAGKATIDLNGHTLTSTATDEAILLSRPGSAAENLHKKFNLIDSSTEGGGKLVVNPNAEHAILLNNVGTSNAKYTDVIIGKGVTIDGGCISMLSNNSTLIFEGTVNGGNNFAIVTNGNTTVNTDITIKDGAVLTSNGVAMYLPGTGTTTIEEGAKITGSTGIYVKSGTLNINGGEITGNGEKKDYKYWDNGCYSTGDALVVDNCGYHGGNPVVSVSGGTFTSTNAEAIASYNYGENAKLGGFVSGGYFSNQISDDLCIEGKVVIEATDKPGYFTIGDPHYVAQIGETGYVTLQAALDAAHETTGDVTVELLDNISGYSIVHQEAGLNLTIDGKDKTLNGQIIVDGNGRLNDSETLTIKKIKFVGNKNDFYTGTDAFISLPADNSALGIGKYNYAHNVTVSDCSFTSTSENNPEFDVVAFKPSSGKNFVINNVTGTNLHSIAQFTGTEKASVTNCTATECESFVNVSGGKGEFTISGNTFTSAEGASGYGIRENAGSSAVITLTDNTFTAAKAVVLGKKASATNGTINVVSGTYVGDIVKDIAATATGKIVISGGKFSAPLGNSDYAQFIAEGKTGVNGLYPEEEQAKNGLGGAVATITDSEGNVSNYASLESAFADAKDGDTVKPLVDITELASNITVGGTHGDSPRVTTVVNPVNVTFDLNGKTIKSDKTIYLVGGSLNITGEGIIETTGSGVSPVGVRYQKDANHSDLDYTSKRTLTIGENVTLKGVDYGLNIFGSNEGTVANNIEVNINGNIEGTTFVLGNLSNTDNNIVVNVNSGASLKGKVGIALNGFATVNVADNTTIEGTELGIEVRAGNLNVAGGTITSTATEYTVKSNGDGSAAKGAAISVAQHTTKLPISTNITGCTLSGVKTISVADPENGNLAGVTVKVADALANAETVIIPVAYEWVSDGTMSTLTPRDPVAKIEETVYYSLADAVAAVPTDGTEKTITLLADVTENVAVSGGKNIVLDLGEKTLTGYIDLYDSELNVKNGNIAGTVYVNGGPASAEAGYNKFTLANNATITADYGIILYQAEGTTVGYGSTIDINGTVNGMVWVMGNITKGNSIINVNSGASIKGDVGVALNGVATLNVADNTTIEGAEVGIEVRAGNLNVEGGTITSTATEYSVKSEGSGTTTTGAAIAVAQHTTKLPINANILGGTLSGIKTISVTDPEGGNYEGVVVTAKDELTKKENNVIPDGYIWVSNNNGTSTLALTEETEMVLIDGETCPVKATATYKTVTYRRTFADNHKDKYQGWYVPFDYTIKTEDLENFDFYKIHLIAASAEESGEVTDISRIFIHIESVAEGYVLKANKPYFVVPKTTGTFEFTPEGEGVILYAPVSTSRLHLATSEFDYNFYGNYDAKMYATKPHDWLMMKGGQICWNTDATNWLPSYRWYIKVNANNSDADYSKIGFSIVGEDDATSIDSVHSMDNSDIEGYYTINGLKLEKPVKGINIIRYNNGKTKKVILK